jgi:peptidase E
MPAGRRIGGRPERRRIVAMGGGGFSGAHGDPALDRYVLDIAERQCARICLLPTASGDPQEQIQRFYRAYYDLDCEPTHLSLFRLGTRPVDLRALLLGQDVIYVGGGSLLNLLAIWRAHGLDSILREAWERGVVLGGISAGSMCWFTAGVTTGFGRPRAVEGLGFLPESNSVHHHSEPERRPCFHEAVRTELAPPGYAVDDGVGLLFAGTGMVEAVSARRGAGAWWVEGAGERALESPLDVTELPGSDGDGPPAPPLEIAEFRRAREQGGGPPRNRPARRVAGIGD